MKNDGKILLIIGFLASLITIFVFITGKENIFALQGDENESAANNTIVERAYFNQLSNDSLQLKVTPRGRWEDNLEDVWLYKSNYKFLLYSFPSRKYLFGQISPNKQKLILIIVKDFVFNQLIILNTDSTNIQTYNLYAECPQVFDNKAQTEAKNIIWLADNKVKIQLNTWQNAVNFRLENHPLPKSGDYIITLDKYNTITQVKPYQP
jgi:hypothetical protein